MATFRDNKQALNGIFSMLLQLPFHSKTANKIEVLIFTVHAHFFKAVPNLLTHEPTAKSLKRTHTSKNCRKVVCFVAFITEIDSNKGWNAASTADKKATVFADTASTNLYENAFLLHIGSNSVQAKSGLLP